VDSEVLLAEVYNRCRVFEIISVLSEGQEGFVIYSYVAIFKCLGARLEELDLTGEYLAEEGLLSWLV